MGMRALLVAVAAVVLAGCGSGGDPGRSAEKPPAACPGNASATTFPQVDLTGAGAVDVGVTASTGSCANQLRADLGDRAVSLDLGEVRLDPADARAVTIPGRTGQMLAARSTHPRGGFQWHLYGVADGELAEILADGQPPIPFVATDTRPQPPMTVACHGSGLRVTQARAHEPPGVLFTWDLDRIDIAITGNHADVTGPVEIEDNVVPSIMARTHLDLVKQQMFVGCPG